jgi:hypothetical protein
MGGDMDFFSRADVERALAPLTSDELFQRIRVSEFRPELGEDWRGEPAIWIYVLIPDDVPPELVRGPHIEERFRIRDALEAAGWTGPVYPQFRLVSEDREALRSAVPQ